ncbi:pyridoxal phosphate-dependent decarboxylase family protein [Luteibaculum oceani]|uniref:Aminotransferase class V-fold PLP-dependent enzyme n=1 Tax=Luteibaculum oceani TaxID=1294296 RepID=A0A5C6URV9_9FLAO|nr:aminotransferase class V-fold PLP-dependent enzyme [Luteibaculum oceani]TXC76043.1 aminotransferase class V-fold PLP-dependent enzyme [Luteibaculum oceani]
MGNFLAYDRAYWKQFIDSVHGQINNWTELQEQSEVPVLKKTDIQKVIADFESSENWQSDLSKIFNYSNHLYHPGYAGHQVVPPSIPSALAGYLANYFNQGMAVYDMGQAANAIERIVLKRLRKAFGWDDAEGIMTSGGSIGNLTALLAARQAFDDVWEKGVEDHYTVLVSEDAHYCVDRAVRIMGFGAKGVCKIKPNDQHKITGEALQKAIAEVRKENRKIIAVVGSACSTGPGIFDDLQAMGEICQQEKIWFHVDAAHGGLFQLSQKLKPLLKGAELANSMVIDFHKMGFTPALTTSVLFKNGLDSYKTFKQDAAYLWPEESSEPYAQSGLRTLECTKLMMGLKAYANLKWLGEPEMARMMEYLVDLAHQFAAEIKKRSAWELFQEPEANIVCFKLKNVDKSSALAFLDGLIKQGTHYIVGTTISGQFYFRVSIMNVATNLEHLTAILDQIEKLKNE